MDESFTIQISRNLVKQLAKEGEQLKKKARKPKAKLARKPKREPEPTHIRNEPNLPFGGTDWPLQSPLYLPVPPPQYLASAELEAIRSVLEESEKVMEKLEKREKEMGEEVTQRAKDLHEKEFKIPERKPVPCLAEQEACFECYKEYLKNPLKCADLVDGYAGCVSRARQVMNLSAHK